MSFKFTDEQKQNLLKWSLALQSDSLRQLRAAEDEAVAKARALLQGAKFAAGTDLTADDFVTFLGLARKLTSNRQMNRTLYENVGVQAFNAKLRALLYGPEPLWVRLAGIASVPNIGHLGASQFLCLSDPQQFPLVSKQCSDVIGLTDEQKDDAEAEAVAESGIDPEHPEYRWTARFLRRALVLRRVRDLLRLKDYLDVNLFLYARSLAELSEESDSGGDGEPEPTPYTSVAFEEQLRDYIAEHPTRLGAGLTLWDPEQPTEYRTPVGNIDVLLKDGKVPVVVETKRDKSSDDVVGQALRYMGWWKSQGHKKVRGIIVVHRPDPKLDAAMLMAPEGLVLRYYRLQFEISDKAFPEQQRAVAE